VSDNPYTDPGLRSEMREMVERGRRELLAAMSPAATLQRADLLVRLGQEHEYVYYIERGWLARSRTTEDGRRQVIVIFLPGEFCGIKTIFMARQPDDIEALTEAATRRVHYKEACALAAKDVAVAMLLAWQLSVDERHLHNWNLRLGRANADERIAALLLELRERLLRLGVDARERYFLPLTQSQLADHVGLTPVHVNRTLRRLRSSNMVSMHRNEVRFLENVAELEELARPVRDVLGE
jgi:CRP/FNR family transcriptional regulator, anaerobic regulatory protein